MMTKKPKAKIPLTASTRAARVKRPLSLPTSSKEMAVLLREAFARHTADGKPDFERLSKMIFKWLPVPTASNA